MKRLLMATAAMLALAGAAQAQVLDDPLHGYVMQNGVPTNTDTGSISPIQLGGSGVTGFGFFASPAPQTGDLWIAILDPTNIAVTGTPTLSTNLGTGGAFTLKGTWTAGGGDLATFLGFSNASPSNPFSAFASPDTADANGIPTGFNVYLLDVGSLTLQDLALSQMIANISGGTGFLTAGVEITGFMVEGNSTVSTAPSGVLEITTASVPGPIVGAGLPGLISAGLGLLALARRRRNRLIPTCQG